MAEKDHYAALVEGANAEGWALWRLPDAPGLPPRPADIAGGDPNGRWVLVEVKEVDRFRTFDSLHFESSQIRWLRACAARSGWAIVAVKESEGEKRMLLFLVAGSLPAPVDGVGTLQVRRWMELTKIGEQWRGWRSNLAEW